MNRSVFTNGLYTKGTRAHTQRELIREWLIEPTGGSLDDIYLGRFIYKGDTSTYAQGTDPRVALGAYRELP